jgi:hypothetical protein
MRAAIGINSLDLSAAVTLAEPQPVYRFRTKARVKSLDLCRKKFLLVRMILREKRSRGKTEGVCPLAPASGAALRRYPETGGTWLCVQHEEDGANACTCADESI